jgi:4-methylaminobutanoate oxidase (formaldehyde-forming)
MHWLQKNMPNDANCSLFDATSSEGCIAIMGPNSRDLIQSLTDADMSNKSFPFANVRNIELGMANVRAHRITYVGELGWELYFPIEFSSYVAELLDEKGKDFSLRHIGMHTVDSCRIEKAYRHFGHDITDEDHVINAGLGFAVKLDKKPSKYGNFIGHDSVQSKKTSGYDMRVMQFLLDNPDLMLYHNEPILKNGEIVGHLTSGTYSHTLGSAVGLGYIPCKPNERYEDILNAEYTIEVEGVIEKCKASLKPMYDPLNEKIRI